MKYFSRKVTYKGIQFDSKYEMERFIYLEDLESKGIIQNLQRQVEFEIIPPLVFTVPKQLKTKVKWVQHTEEKAAKYTCDFMYEQDGKIVVEEFKSEYTAKLADYVLRRKLIKKLLADKNAILGEDKYNFVEVKFNGKKSTEHNSSLH